MKRLILSAGLLFSAVVCTQAAKVTIVHAGGASFQEKLAAKELRRYIYLLTDTLPSIESKGSGDTILVRVDDALEVEEYRLVTDATGTQLTITGGSPVATLYGAYQVIEHLGVRFYLHGDVIPDFKTAWEMPVLNETGKPLFALRGILPFHDFFEGPDWWNVDDYKAYVGQMAKLRMNFIGLHQYPPTQSGEPTVWIGLPEDTDEQGQVSFTYPALFANTERPGWGNLPMKTSGYAGGAATLFPGDMYGPDAMAGHFPWPKGQADTNEVFTKTAAMYHDAFTLAQSFGIKICVGTEAPLTVPGEVQARLKAQGRNPSDPDVVKDLYTGMFKRLSGAFPVDYYWLWTPENWTWGSNTMSEYETVMQDIQSALAGLEQAGDPLKLGTCGWVLGPAHDRAALDDVLPDTSPMACISRNLGHEGIEPAFANLVGRPKWAIPWLENDVNMVGPQPWVGRMRYDAVDALRFGCTGLFGIHWRTKALEMNVASLAAAGWDQSWVPEGFDVTPVEPVESMEGALGGGVAKFGEPVSGTDTQAVFQTVRYGVAAYSLNVPNGSYSVTLQLNEPLHTEAGKRVFGVKIQGSSVVTDLDIFARADRNHALNLTYPDIEVTDGTLRIDFSQQVELPCIAGIVIEGNTKAVNQIASQPFSRRINCGGPAMAEYEADLEAGGGVKPSPKSRSMPIDDFYLDYARANFGQSVAIPLAELLAGIDGLNMPQVSEWEAGPGSIIVNKTPWESVRKDFEFVDQMAALRSKVVGAGNLDRFDYWLQTYQAASAMAEAGCLRAELDQAMEAKKWQAALSLRIELARLWTQIMTLQTSIVRTPGELGTIANLEHQTRGRRQFVAGHDEELVKALGRPLPPEAAPGEVYTGPAQLILPTVRSMVVRGETLKLKIIALDQQPVQSVKVHVRPLAGDTWREIPAQHVGRAVYAATLPAAQDDFEYGVSAVTASGERLIWPPTAPKINQTVVVAPE